jgi:hypothetical protein
VEKEETEERKRYAAYRQAFMKGKYRPLLYLWKNQHAANINQSSFKTIEIKRLSI